MSPEASRPYGGRSADERVAERRAKLIASATRLLAEGGLSAATVRNIADQAGVSRRFFYESFSDLDALLDAIYQHVLAECTTAVVEAATAAAETGGDFARETITAFVRIVDRNPALFRAGLVEAVQAPALRPRMQAATDLFVNLAADQAKTAYNLPDEMDELVLFGSRMLVAGSVETITAWVDNRLDISADRLIDLMSDHYRVITTDWSQQVRSGLPS